MRVEHVLKPRSALKPHDVWRDGMAEVVGFGRIVASETEIPLMLVKLA
jgi:hypothetical protein